MHNKTLIASELEVCTISMWNHPQIKIWNRKVCCSAFQYSSTTKNLEALISSYSFSCPFSLPSRIKCLQKICLQYQWGTGDLFLFMAKVVKKVDLQYTTQWTTIYSLLSKTQCKWHFCTLAESLVLISTHFCTPKGRQYYRESHSCSPWRLAKKGG